MQVSRDCTLTAVTIVLILLPAAASPLDRLYPSSSQQHQRPL